MATPVWVVGHKHPDNDAISAAVGYAYLKNQLMARELEENPDAEVFEYKPARLGPLPEESEGVLSEFGVEPPEFIDSVSPRVRDIMSSPVISIDSDVSLLEAGKLFSKNNVRAVAVNDENGKYVGLMTQRSISEHYIAAMSASAARGIDLVQVVAVKLVNELMQPVSDFIETEVQELYPDARVKDVKDLVLESSLREAVVLNTQGECIGIVTRTDLARRPKRKVILVDHNERSQAVGGIADAEILEIIDHHRIGDISTSNPIRFLNVPVGSSATIVTTQFRENNVEIPKGIAAVLLSAIMTDTVILKSPTTTPVDHAQAAYLANIIGEEVEEFGLRVFRFRKGDAEMPVSDLVTADSKEFKVENGLILIAQHETVNLGGIMEREEEIREFLKDLQQRNEYLFAILLVTDIFAEGSQFIVEGDHAIVDKVFDIDSSQSVWMPGVMSRKKQVAAPLLSV